MRQTSSVCSSCGIEYLGFDKSKKCPGCRKLDELTRGEGIIRWFDPRRGYGFIRSEHHGDLFFHHSDLYASRRVIHPNVPVTFLVERTDSGVQARQVRINQDAE